MRAGSTDIGFVQSPAVLSGLAVESELGAGRLRAVVVEGEPIVRSVRAVWSRTTVPSTGALALLHQLGLSRPGRSLAKLRNPPGVN